MLCTLGSNGHSFSPSYRTASRAHNCVHQQQRSAHEQPVIFWSFLIGSVGPLAVVTVPPIRKSFGWVPAERIPTSYPCEYHEGPDRAMDPRLTQVKPIVILTTCRRSHPTSLILDLHSSFISTLIVPERPREEVSGYDDE